MVFFVLTRPGYDELIRQLGKPPKLLWVNEGIFSREELEEKLHQGVDITNFTYTVDAQDFVKITAAVQTIQEHHSGHRVWVEFPASR